jgi:hypothetical protein
MSEHMQDPQDGAEPIEPIEAIEPVEEVAAPAIDPELEVEARKYGWRPKEEFDRNPEGWVDAERFLQLPQTQVKALRDMKRELERGLKERDAKLANIERATRVVVDRTREQERARYEAELARIEAAKREAVENADPERYDRLTEMQRRMTPPAEIDAASPPAQQVPPELNDYMASASWLKDPSAFAFARNLIDSNPELMMLPPLKQVQAAEKKVREYFPEHFAEPAKPKPAGPARVDGGGLGGAFKRGKTAADLPPEVRQAGLEYVQDKTFASLDDYAKAYFAHISQGE